MWTTTQLAPVFQHLVGYTPAAPCSLPAGELAQWLMRYDLAPLAYHTYRARWPELAKPLQADYFRALAEQELLTNLWHKTRPVLQTAGFDAILLKGLAVAHLVYPKPELRVMSDLDVWVRPADLTPAGQLLQQTLALQKVSTAKKQAHTSKIELFNPQMVKGMIDLQGVLFAGHWFKPCPIPEAEIWQRAAATPFGRVLNPEDALLHTLIHIAINHQFDATTFRALCDVGWQIQKRPPDWDKFCQQAAAWRVRRPVWHVLYLFHQLVPLPQLPPVLKTLQPSVVVQKMLTQFAAWPHLFQSQRLNRSVKRYLYLLTAVEQPGRSGRGWEL